ncbi:MAG: hypothetical protein ACREKL_13525 [Chthoniobacterales bacterium]
MKSFLLSTILLAAGFSTVAAQTTPLTDPLPEEKETPITCELKTAPSRAGIPVFTEAKDGKEAVGTYHYKLWIPKGYAAAPAKKWPCMFIMSPGGNAGMGSMGDYLKANGFVVVMLTEAKNGQWPPIVGNFLAAHDDVVKRVRIAEGQKYATGFSGGARGSSVFVQARPGFCGLVLQGAGASQSTGNKYNVTGIRANSKLYTVLTMGTTDDNKKEEEPLKRALGASKFEIIEFEGGHQGASAEVFAKAMDWIKSKTGGSASAFGR